MAFILRASYAIFVFFTKPLPANNVYYEIAELILNQGRVFYYTDNLYYESAGPVIPWINALTMLILGKSYLGLYLVTALASGFITFYTYKTARLFLDKQTSMLAGIWSLFYLFYFYFTPSPGKDIWMAFLMILLIFNFITLFIRGRFSWLNYCWFIVMFVVSFHIDERYFIFAPFLGLYILFHETKRLRVVTIWRTTVFVVLLLLLSIPWSLRNYETHEKIVLLSTRTERYTDKLFGYTPRVDHLEGIYDIYGDYYIKEHQLDSIISGEKTHTDMGRRISPAMAEAMRRGNLPAPLKGFRAFASRLQTMFEPFQVSGRFERTGYFWYEKSLRHNIATFFFYGILLIFSIPGFVILFRTDKNTALLLLCIILVYALVHALAIPYTNWRYRLPLDSIFIIAGCTGIMNTYRYLATKTVTKG